MRRFLNHEHLTDEIGRIEYIECSTYADMVWKEIYYINFYANEFTTNSLDLYIGGVTDLHLDDNWKCYSKNTSSYYIDKDKVMENLSLSTNKELINSIPLIHILENEKLNSVGKNKYALSRKWFYDDSNKSKLNTLSKHVANYFHNICKAKSHECLWTTFDEAKPQIKGKGFRKGFVSLNAPYEKTNIRYLAFLCNLFYQPDEDSEFRYSVDENGYALSEMLQFIWRSAIHDGKEIWVYIPSIRMRRLLKQWVKENSLGE